MRAVKTLAAAASHTPRMKAIIHRKYGEPGVLTLGEAGRPLPGDDDALVRVFAAGMGVGDYHIVTGTHSVIRLRAMSC
jgi:NADPH:quinone reductase-like Zn-dependent oxidoreductase